MTDRRASFPVDLKLAIARRGKTIGMVADEARVPQHALKDFLDGRFDINPAFLRRLEMWFDRVEVPRPGVAQDYPAPATRHLNMASLAREFEAMKRQIDSLKGKVDYLEAQLVYALSKEVLT